jgi:hypothetical protein
VVLSITPVNASAAHEAWRPWNGISATAGGPLRSGRRRSRRAARRGRKAARSELLAGRNAAKVRGPHPKGIVVEHMTSKK